MTKVGQMYAEQGRQYDRPGVGDVAFFQLCRVLVDRVRGRLEEGGVGAGRWPDAVAEYPTAPDPR